jgi:hypothetical protein
MAWTPTKTEIAAVLQLDAPKRYSYWVKKTADQQVVWSLWQQDGWALAGDDQGHELVPVWPHEKFAGLCSRDVWAGYLPKPVDLDIWIERWIPGMERDSRLVAVFPTPEDRGVIVEPAKVADDLREELANYE